LAGKKKPVVMIIDSREKDQELIGYLEKFGAHLHKDTFEIGDIGILGKISFAIEHKSVDDLAKSLADGRLFKQIKDMVDMARVEGDNLQPVLLLIGDIWKLWKIRGYDMWQIAALLNSIQFAWGVQIIYAHNNMFAAVRLVSLARKYQMTDEKKKEHPMRFGAKRKMKPIDEARYVLEGFPGISVVRARKILEHYKTLGEALDAMRSGTITEVDKIGPKTAEEVKKVFGYGVERDGEGEV